jgi:hypothetical protein
MPPLVSAALLRHNFLFPGFGLLHGVRSLKSFCSDDSTVLVRSRPDAVRWKA